MAEQNKIIFMALLAQQKIYINARPLYGQTALEYNIKILCGPYDEVQYNNNNNNNMMWPFWLNRI